MRRAERAAVAPLLRALRREVGLWGSARVLSAIALGRARGEPFAVLGAASDERDRLSRKQCGDVVLIDRALRRIANREAALRVAEVAVSRGGVTFLDAMLPPVPTSGLGEFARQVVAQFFNAEGTTEADEEAATFRFEVHRCRFVELLQAVDAAHLAHLFCQVDEHYFQQRQTIQLRRTKTLAKGDEHCNFEFNLRR